MPVIPTWLWLGAAASLTPAGLWLLIRGRPFRRTQRFRTCPKCSYNMSGLESLTCPECGRTARNERELHRKAGRAAWRFAGLFALIAGAACYVALRSVEHGLPGVFPDWLLVRCASLDAPPPPASAWSVAMGSAPSPDPTFAERLNVEVCRRFKTGTISEGAKIHFLRRAYSLTDAERTRTLASPTDWPADIPFSAWTPLPNTHNFPVYVWCSTRIAQRNGAPVVTYTVASREYVELEVCAFEHPIDISRPADTFMRPVASPQLDADVFAALNPRLYVRQFSHLYVDGRSNTAAWGKVPCFLCYDAQLMINDRVVGTCFGGAGRDSPSGSQLYGLPITWSDGGREAALTNAGELRIRVTGIPRRCVEEFVNRSWSFPPEAWSGTITAKPVFEPQ